MRYTLFLFLLILAIIYSCKDDVINNSNNMHALTTLSGKADNWGDRGSKLLFLQILDSNGYSYVTLDSTFTDASGNFTINLKEPSVPLPLFRNRGQGICSVYYHSNVNDLKYATVTISFREDNYSISYIQNMSDISIGAGDTRVWYNYFDNDAQVDGYEGCTSYNGKTSFTYNFSCAKGWNPLYIKYKKFINTYNYEADVTNTRPGYIRWWVITTG